ncbi:MAG: AMP-binding protein [Abditibacteriota bacterium]|nr:AMP-binding protein [Abditibacteriota bacterium]
MLEKFLKQSSFSSYEDMIQNFKLEIPEHYNFAYDVVDGWAKEDPERIALYWTNPEGHEKKISFAKMKEYSDRLSNALTSLGVGRDDVVALILKRRWEYWPSIIACHKIGARALPINHLMKKKDLIYRFNMVECKAVIAVDEKMLIDEIELAKDQCKYLKVKIMVDGEKDGWFNWNKIVDKASPDWKRPFINENSDVMLMYYTSGTTGLPKVVAHNHLYSLAHIITAKLWLNCEDGGLHLTVSDTGWGKAVWGKLYGQWICGSTVFVYDYDRFVADDILNLFAKYKITTFCAPPTIYRFFVKEDLSKYDFSSLHYVCTAGEALHPEVFNVFEKQTGLKIYEGFGQTETVCMLATFPGVEPHPGSMGKPSPSYNVCLVDDDLMPVENGEEGHLVVDLGDVVSDDENCPKYKKFSNFPYGLFESYIYESEFDKDKYKGKYYFTGDMAWRDEDGYYWFVGRSDDVIKTSGYRVGPFEIESVLMEHPAVLECAITGVPDPIRGQVVKATIVLTKDYSPSDELASRLKEYVKGNTAPYKYPRVIEFVKELPKTISGKIRRVDIRENKKENPDE